MECCSELVLNGRQRKDAPDKIRTAFSHVRVLFLYEDKEKKRIQFYDKFHRSQMLRSQTIFSQNGKRFSTLCIQKRKKRNLSDF